MPDSHEWSDGPPHSVPGPLDIPITAPKFRCRATSAVDVHELAVKGWVYAAEGRARAVSAVSLLFLALHQCEQRAYRLPVGLSGGQAFSGGESEFIIAVGGRSHFPDMVNIDQQ